MAFKPKTSISSLPGRRRAVDREKKRGPSKLLDLAARILACYVIERTIFENRTRGTRTPYKPPAGYFCKPTLCIDGDTSAVVRPGSHSVWYKAALRMQELDLGVEPEVYIRFQFENIELHRRIPEPPQLFSQERLELWEERKDLIAVDVAVRLEREKRIAEAEYAFCHHSLKRYAAWTNVLLDESLNLSPLFRYCIAALLGAKSRKLKALLPEFEEGAITQYLHYRRFYQQSWKTMLPSGFDAMAVEQGRLRLED